MQERRESAAGKKFCRGPLAFGLDSAAALPSFAAFPRFSSLIATPTSVHVAMSLGCNVEKSNAELVTTALRWVAVIWLVIAPPPGRGEARRLPA